MEPDLNKTGSHPDNGPMAGALPQLGSALPRLFGVKANRKETHDTATLTLAPLEGEPLAFQPGQFNMLWVPGVGEAPISISGAPDQPQTLLHTIRAVGAVSGALCQLKPGDTLGVRGPFGQGWPVERAKGHDVVLVAGGIGLAPLRPVMCHLLANRDAYGRVALLVGARAKQEMLYLKELEHWRSRFDLQVEATVDHGGSGWLGHVGVVTKIMHRVRFDPDATLAMVCGPEVMIRFAARGLEEAGVAAESVYLSLERNMKCGLGNCGHCQLGPMFVCKDGPVVNWAQAQPKMAVREL